MVGRLADGGRGKGRERGVGVLEGGGKWVVDWWLWVVGREGEEGGGGEEEEGERKQREKGARDVGWGERIRSDGEQSNG